MLFFSWPQMALTNRNPFSGWEIVAISLFTSYPLTSNGGQHSVSILFIHHCEWQGSRDVFASPVTSRVTCDASLDKGIQNNEKIFDRSSSRFKQHLAVVAVCRTPEWGRSPSLAPVRKSEIFLRKWIFTLGPNLVVLEQQCWVLLNTTYHTDIKTIVNFKKPYKT